MKTKLSILAILPALILASCNNYGKEVKDEAEINDLKTSISAKSGETKNYELTIKTDSVSYDDETGKNVATKSTMLYKANENEELYLKSSGTRDDEKSETEAVLVQNETYEKVFYVSSYNPDTKKNDISVYGYEGNEMTFAFAALYFIIPASYLTVFADPALLDFDEILSDGESGHDYDVETKYFSKGDGNLTIKADVKTKGDVNKDEEEYAATATYTVTYDNYYLKSAHIDSKSNKGNKSVTDVSLTVKDKVTIELPKGWEDLINKNTEPEGE